jgi:hypothetical protein
MAEAIGELVKDANESDQFTPSMMAFSDLFCKNKKSGLFLPASLRKVHQIYQTGPGLRVRT